jgi:polyisoprenoid-binding protein YceI
MRRRPFAGCLAAIVIIITTAGTYTRGAAPRTFQIDPARSRFVIDVGKAGLLSFAAGHAHEVETRAIEGAVEFDPQAPLASTVRMQIDSASLRVTGKGEPAKDVPEVQSIMLGERVLDVRRYPTIVFESTTVARATAADTYSVTGRLTLRGKTLSLAIPVKAQVAGDTLTATGRTTIKQTEYGITPISVAGVVKVKDELAISFTIVGTAR